MSAWDISVWLAGITRELWETITLLGTQLETKWDISNMHLDV